MKEHLVADEKAVAIALNELDAKKSDSGHTHDDRYSITGHNHNDKYYTKSEMDNALSGKMGEQEAYVISENINDLNTRLINHTHNQYSLTGHNHDSQYSLINHTHDDRYSLTGHNHDGQYSLINHTHDDRYSLTEHNHDSQYSLINHTHNQYSLTGHNHDDRYSLSGHNHDDRYSLSGHNHDDRYYTSADTYTKGEIDLALSGKMGENEERIITKALNVLQTDKINISAIASNITSASTNNEVASAKAVYNIAEGKVDKTSMLSTLLQSNITSSGTTLTLQQWIDRINAITIDE